MSGNHAIIIIGYVPNAISRYLSTSSVRQGIGCIARNVRGDGRIIRRDQDERRR
jgi:hypothetical protein